LGWLLQYLLGKDSVMNVFDEMGVYWAEIADKDQTEQQIHFLKTHFKPGGYVLDIACGTGRHTIPLSQRVYCMVGLDVSAKLLRIAKQRSKGIQLVRGDMRFLPFKPGAFAAAISMDTSFGYLPSDEDDRVSLIEVQRVLLQGGVFVVDVFNREQLIAKYSGENQPSKWREYPSFSLQQKRSLSPDGDWLCDLWTIRDKTTGQLLVFEHSVRLYKSAGLRGLLENAGLAVKAVFGSYDGGNFSSDSPRLIFVAKAK
jgi:ubiquinone/menaquinone biosynthesis C-methylase UbiE